MNQGTVNIRITIRHDLAINWKNKNPILLAGEFGLEDDTLLIKVGNGISNWLQLSYINKLDSSCLMHANDGSLTFSESFQNQIQDILNQLDAPLIITNDPVAATDPANKRYVDAVVAAIVNNFTLSPATQETLGGVKSSSAPNQITVGQDGFMTMNKVSTSLLYVPEGDDFIINGGTA